MRFFYLILSASLLISGVVGAIPPGFKMGVATASYQIEGGWKSDGKGENIWDRFTHTYPNSISDKSNGDVACDSYHLWQEDVEMLKFLNVDFYRFSLSWSRILPLGSDNLVNSKGLDYYNNLIDQLLVRGIEPVVTLYHWDLPQNIQDLGGWTNSLTIEYYKKFAAIAFSHFGDRVKTWITINEPSSICVDVYENGNGAPNIVSKGVGSYICGKNVLLAHANVYKLYEDHFRAVQKGQVGITVDSIWAEPKSNNQEDLDVANREMQMSFGWFVHPIFSASGDYPNVMKTQIANRSALQNYSSSRLPELSPSEINLLRDSADFLGLNHYHTWMVQSSSHSANEVSFAADKSTSLFKNHSWSDPTIQPWGLRKLLNWIRIEYNNPLVYVTENGISDTTGTLNDTHRVDFIQQYVDEVFRAATEDGCKVSRYTVWSLMDNMEWTDGYMIKYGLFHVDFKDSKRTRTKKSSAYFFKGLCQRNEISINLV